MAQMDNPQPMSRLINWALHDLMLTHPETMLMGEDVGRKGGVYGVTQKLQGRFGPGRVIDTLLDEQSILGLAIGMAHNGFVPMPEIQFLAYLHNAEDQLRGEAATLPFFSDGQWQLMSEKRKRHSSAGANGDKKGKTGVAQEQKVIEIELDSD